MVLGLAGLAAALLAGTLLTASAPPPPVGSERRVLLFTRTEGFRHDSIPDAIAAIRALGEMHGFAVDATEATAAFSDAGLEPYDAVMFLLTTGDVLDAPQEQALERFIRGGGGFVGVHSAADTEHGWPWYLALVGAEFRSHPAIQPASLTVVDRLHPSTRDLPELWNRTDEWYDFVANPRSSASVHVLVTLDESSYAGGTMGEDHPVAWCRYYDGGRTFYTALGHTSPAWSEPLFLGHLLGGLAFSAGWSDCEDRRPSTVAPRPGR